MSAVVKPPSLRYRSATVTDISDIMAIEERVYKFPWTRRIFLDCIRVGYSCECCEADGRLIAYGIMSMGANEAHVLNLCVDPDWQNQGIGHDLLQHLLDIAGENAVDTVFLEVRPSNHAAVALYEKLGFNTIGTRKDYYPAQDGREDAMILARTIFHR
jgi:ribosomal-protein-alanine N-acetyltransferase